MLIQSGLDKALQTTCPNCIIDVGYVHDHKVQGRDFVALDEAPLP